MNGEAKDLIMHGKASLETLEEFVSSGGRLESKNDADGLVLVLWGDKPAAVSLLVKAGADVNERDEQGRTALFYARSAVFAEALIQAGADVHLRDKEGYTALHFVCSLGRKTEAIKVLIDAKSDVNSQSLDGETPLDKCIVRPTTQHLVELLIASGSEVNILNFAGQPPFWSGGFQFVPLFLRAGANINAKSSKGHTCLHYVFLRSVLLSQSEIQELLRLGADPRIPDNEGRKPSDYAKQDPRHLDPIVAMLVAREQELDLRDRHGVSSGNPRNRRRPSL